MQLYSGYWVVLPQEVRNLMRAYFNIPKSTGTHVENGRLVSDGCTDEDLKFVSLEKMQALLKSDSDDFGKLLDLTVEHFKSELSNKQKELEEKAKKEYEAVSEEEAKVTAEVVQEVVEAVVKRRGRKAKK